MNVRINLKNMLGRQTVLPGHFDRNARHHVKGWTRILPLVSPRSREWQLRMHLVLEFHHANAISNFILVRTLRSQSFRNWEWIKETL